MESEMNRLLSMYRRRRFATDNQVDQPARHTGIAPGGAVRRTLAVLIGCAALLAVAPVAAQAATASITGTVTSAKSGGAVGLQGISVTATNEHGVVEGIASTEAGGVYKLLGLAAGEYTVEFSDPGQVYLPLSKTAILEEAKNTVVDAEMKEGDTVSGTVTNAANGNGLGNVQVRVEGGGEEAVAFTEANGDYVVRDLPVGSYLVEIVAPSGYVPQSFSTTFSLEGELKTVSAALKEGGKISGRVTDAVTHNGLGKIDVFVSGSKGEGGFVSTNANGEYTVTGLASGSYQVGFFWKYSAEEIKACAKSPQCPPKYISQYFNDQPSEKTANTVGTTEGSTTSGINAAMVPAAPVNSAAPVVSGTPAVGSLLSCSNGSWTGESELTLSAGWPFTTPFTYQWLRDGSAITAATSNAYLVQAADLGHGLVCEVTATNVAGHASAKSNSLAIPLPVPVIAVSSAKIAVSGGAARVPLACSPATTCTGTLELTRQVTVRGHGKGKKQGKAKRKTVVLGKVSYSLAAGKSVTLLVRLTGVGKGALGKARGHRLAAQLLVSVAGGASVTKPVVLSQAKPKGKHK
jgi:hypothetical protein